MNTFIIELPLTLLITFEFILAVTHALILTRIRTTKRENLLSKSYYFQVDFIVPILSIIAMGGFLNQYHAMYNGFHAFIHLFYLIGWDRTIRFKKIFAWNSLEWKDKTIDLECFPLTCYDISVHLISAYLMSLQLQSYHILIAIALTFFQIRRAITEENGWVNPRDPKSLKILKTKKSLDF